MVTPSSSQLVSFTCYLNAAVLPFACFSSPDGLATRERFIKGLCFPDIQMSALLSEPGELFTRGEWQRSNMHGEAANEIISTDVLFLCKISHHISLWEEEKGREYALLTHFLNPHCSYTFHIMIQ